MVKKWIFGFVSVLILVIASGLIYISNFIPDIPLREINVDLTPERVARGEYLANHVTVCIDCHGTRDWSKFSGPIIPGTEGKGGELFDQKMGLPGKYISPNITPFNLSDWTDGEIYRAITSGVGKRNNPLFPIMPYKWYGMMDDEDIFSIIAYIRSLPEIESKSAESVSDFPVNILINTMPEQGKPGTLPEKGTPEYGKYMTISAGCVECHTPFENGALIMESAYAGGREFPMPGGLLKTPNITPDKATGIGEWTEEFFLSTFKNHQLDYNEVQDVQPTEFNSIMPWTMYAGMDTTDILAIYSYLRTLEPRNNPVIKFVPY